MPDQQNQPPAPPGQRSPGERGSRLVTDLIKLGGLAVVLHGAFGPGLTTGDIAIAAFMMAGARSLETFAASFFGGGEKR